MKTNKIYVDAAKTLGKNMQLTGMREVYKYVNGERTNEQDGYRYEVVLINNGFEKINFKVENNAALFTEEQVEQNIFVKAINPQLTLYPNYKGGEVGLNVTADSMVVVNE